MELNAVMRTTFAARRFTGEPLPDAVLGEILEHARFAPSGGNRQGNRAIVVRDPDTRTALAKLYPFAAAHHDAWERCRPAVRKLHARNVAVIGGPGVTEPVSAVVCWTMRGRVEGGTGVAIRLAETAGIPVFNLASVHPRDVCIAMNRIAQTTRAGEAA